MAKDLASYERAECIIYSQSMSEMWTHHIENMREFGFDRMIFASTPFSSHDDWGDPDDRMVLANYPAPVVDAFLADRLHQKAAKIARPELGVGAYSWRNAYAKSTPDVPLTADENRHRALCEEWDITAGYTIWFNEIGQRRKAVLGLCARRGLSQKEIDDIWARDGQEIHALCSIMHLKASTLPAPSHRDLLTARQREVLNLVADGHSVLAVANILDRSPGTIEKHLRLAREALNAETTANAVRKAAELNQLFMISAAR